MFSCSLRGSSKLLPFQVLSSRVFLANLSIWLPHHFTACFHSLLFLVGYFSFWVYPAPALISVAYSVFSSLRFSWSSCQLEKTSQAATLDLSLEWMVCGVAGYWLAPILSCFFMEKNHSLAYFLSITSFSYRNGACYF